jgi:hypothetical protein
MPYVYDNNFAVERIAAEFIDSQTKDDLAFQILPLRSSNFAELRWTQEDSDFGLQQWRGMNGEPASVPRLGETTTVFEPAVHGEFSQVDEQELTKRAQLDTNGLVPVDINDLIGSIDKQLIRRDLARKRSSIWAALQGSLQLTKPGPNGTVMQTFTYPVQTYTAPVAFTNLSTSAPISVFQAVQQMQIGRSVDFGAGAMAIANNYTLNNILNNSNAADFGGRRNQFGATINNLANVASYWQAQNLPKLIGYDDGYYNTQVGAQSPGPANFTKFIPNNKILVIGKRTDNAPIGNYELTRNVNNPAGGPGDYRFVQDYANGINAPKQVPPKIVVHRGHNGGPAIRYSSAIVLISC